MPSQPAGGGEGGGVFAATYADIPEEGGPSARLGTAMGLGSAIGVTVGIMIGAGIFAAPGFVVEYVGSAGAAIVVWVGCGILSLLGALCYSELGAALPESGGEAVYLRRAFGDSPAFLYVWTVTIIAKPAACALISMVSTDYLCRLGYDDLGAAPTILRRGGATALVWALTAAQVVSTALATGAQNGLAVLKMVLVVLVIILGIVEMSRGGPYVSNLSASNSFVGTTTDITDWGLGIANCLWAFNGWNNINLVAGEVRNPERNIPKAAIIALPLVVLCYVWINVSYIAALPLKHNQGDAPIDEATVAGAETLAVDFARVVGGDVIKTIVTVGVSLSAVGACNGNLFAGARLVHASAVSGVLPLPLLAMELTLFSKPTPAAAYLFQGLVTTVLLLAVGDFGTIVEILMWTLWFWYMLTGAGLLWLRYKEPDLPRPYRVATAVPVVFTIAAVFMVVVLFASSPVPCSVAAGIIVAGIPIRYLLRRCDTTGVAGHRETNPGESLRLVRGPKDTESRIELPLELITKEKATG